ncbi:hypothetical protein C5167_004995 [Papaver somniferum]|uniref:F-box associated beta-propeller type 3 domain-containing protein n=1 Tax=Papaver somniferum TaxID=3469 RepID=A0A4Y7JCG4_PAPSO|nr:hypothetical protein C5167_004995 [Papaver somniferum]
MKRLKRCTVIDQVLELPSLENFDVDILCEILSRVPARSIVWSCKHWLSLIRSPHFVESHREDNTWRKTVERPPCISETSVTVNGSIYWMDGGNLWATLAYYRSLVAFDIGSEKFRVISLPKSFRSGTVKLLEVDGCIAILHKMCDFEVKLWIFKDDKDNGSWIEEIILMPSDWDGTNLYQSIQQIPGTDIIILKAKGTYDAPRHFISLYHYDRRMQTFKKVKIVGLPAVMTSPLVSFSLPNSRATSPPIDYGFFTMIESLAPVQKQQQD